MEGVVGEEAPKVGAPLDGSPALPPFSDSYLANLVPFRAVVRVGFAAEPEPRRESRRGYFDDEKIVGCPWELGGLGGGGGCKGVGGKDQL